MAQKIINLPGLGEVVLTKRRGAKTIRLTIGGDSRVKVTLPSWVPYQAGIAFLQTNQAWVAKHSKVSKTFSEGELIGKAHRIHYFRSSVLVPRTRVTDTEIRVTYPASSLVSSENIQKTIQKAGLKALRQEGEDLLPQRLKILAEKHNFEYKSVTLKRLKARWGSCSQKHEITLNIFLMQLPWHLIDYVLVHELVHTKVLHHGPDFWNGLTSCLPDAKLRRKELRNYHPYF